MTIPAILCFDVEPDLRQVPVPGTPSWAGFEHLAQNIARLRDDLSEASGSPANFSWFLRLDPQIDGAYGSARWSIDRYGSTFDRLLEAGDEFGVHAHCWKLGDDGWWNDHGDPAWVAHCVSSSLAAYREAFGRPAPAYRGGDRYIDAAVLAMLQDAGIGVDLTLEPGAPATRGLVSTERSSGSIPAVPPGLQRPFRPRGSDPFSIGDAAADGLVMVPLLAGLGFARHPGKDDGAAVDALVLWTPPAAFRALLLQRLQHSTLTHVAFAVRSDVGADRLSWHWFTENLRFAAEHLGSRVAWVTPSAGRLAILADALASEETAGVTPERADLVAAAEDLQAAVSELEVRNFLLEEEARTVREERSTERSEFDAERTRLETLIADLTAAFKAAERDVITYSAKAAALHQDLHDVSTELHRIQPFVAEAEHLGAALESLRATRWWRLHDRIHPLLAALARRRTRPVDHSP